MTRHHAGLSGIGTYLLDDAVGIALGDVEESGGACGLIVGAGGVDHMAEVIELVAQDLFHLPALLATPLVGMFRVDGAGGIEVAVGLLGSRHHVEHGVDISFQFLVRVGLEHIACALDGLVYIGIVEREAHELRDIPLRGP